MEGWVSHFGLKCSSWTAVNSGTSSRSPCSSIGNTEYKSVCDGNCLGSRNLECIAVGFNMCDILRSFTFGSRLHVWGSM